MGEALALNVGAGEDRVGQVLSEPKAHEPGPRSRAQASPPACTQGCSSPVRRLGLREAETGPPQGQERKTGTSGRQDAVVALWGRPREHSGGPQVLM